MHTPTHTHTGTQRKVRRYPDERPEEIGLHTFQLQLKALFTAVLLLPSFFSHHPFIPPIFSTFSPPSIFCMLFSFPLSVSLYPFHLMQDQSRGYYGVSNTLSLGNRLFLSVIDRR